MKLLVSDYDKTFKSNIKNFKINIKAINNFIKSGNKFVIATGRSFEQIKPDIDKYNINYNYLICNNGLIIFNDKNEILKYNLLPLKDLDFVYNSLSNMPDIKKVDAYNFFTNTLNLKEIIEIHAIFKNKESARNYKKNIEYVRPHLYCYHENENLFIGLNINKANAVSYIQRKENLDNKDIYTIGDSLNDLEMLKKYDGYKMFKCDPGLLFKNIKTINEVHVLVKKINKNTK